MTAHEQEFFEKLAELQKEYGVEILATDDGKGYGMHSALIEIEINIPDSFDFNTFNVTHLGNNPYRGQ